MAALSTSTWGDPAATKHVLLIHGITFSSRFWHHIAQKFASRGKFHNQAVAEHAPDMPVSDAGYFVTAPDLLGHGSARCSSDYTVAALVEELRPLLTAGGNDHPYDIVIGHSLGGVVAAALFPFLKSSRPVRVVLVDPPFEMPPGSAASYKKLFGDMIGNPKTPEAYLKEFPLWTREDAIFFSTSIRLCNVATTEAIMDVGLFILLVGLSSQDSSSKTTLGRFHTSC